MATSTNQTGFNFAYLDEQTKRSIRRALLKAISIPGHQIPFSSREMPMSYGWGTGGIQVTAAIIGQKDILKVIELAGILGHVLVDEQDDLIATGQRRHRR